jgi:hypothetical protein
MRRVFVHIDRLALRNAQATDGADFSEALRVALTDHFAWTATGDRLPHATGARDVVRATLHLPHFTTATQLGHAAAGAVATAIRGSDASAGNS